MEEKILNVIKFFLTGFGIGSFLMVITALQSSNGLGKNIEPKTFIIIYFIVLPVLFSVAGFFIRFKKENTAYKKIGIALSLMSYISIFIFVAVLLFILLVMISGGV